MLEGLTNEDLKIGVNDGMTTRITHPVGPLAARLGKGGLGPFYVEEFERSSIRDINLLVPILQCALLFDMPSLSFQGKTLALDTPEICLGVVRIQPS